MPALFWPSVANGGGDIRVFKADGVTELPREIVFCDKAAETGQIWVKYAGTLSSSVDTAIQIHADGASSDYAVTGTYGRNAVWSDYLAVLHMNTSAYIDSTGNGYDGTANSAPAQVTTDHPFGGTWTSFDGNDDRVTLPTGAALNNSVFSVQAIAKYDTLFETSEGLVGNWSISQGSNYFVLSPNSNRTRFQVAGASTTVEVDDVATTPVTTPQFVTGTSGALSTALLINGVVESSLASGLQFSTGKNVTIGSYYDLSAERSVNAKIGEVRLRLTALTASWVATEYNNQSSPGTFYTASAPVATAPVTPINLSITDLLATSARLNWEQG
jgi:hypothetical protein